MYDLLVVLLRSVQRLQIWWTAKKYTAIGVRREQIPLSDIVSSHGALFDTADAVHRDGGEYFILARSMTSASHPNS